METTLTHRIEGAGPTLLLLNGGLMSIAAWEPVVTRLTERFRVVRFDFRGQLLSPGPAHARMVDHATDVVALLDELGIRKAHLVGASFGAEVAMLLAAHHSDRVASLTSITSTDRLTEQMVTDSLELRDAAEAAARGGDRKRVFDVLVPWTFSEPWLAENPDFVEQRSRVFAMLPPSFFEGLTGLMSALVTLDLTNELPRIVAPTLVIGAELDRIFAPPHSEELARSISGARLEIIPGVGHGAIVEATDRVFDIVIDFVASVGEQATEGTP